MFTFLRSGMFSATATPSNEVVHNLRQDQDRGHDENIIVENSEESVIEVMNGCICCTVRGDLTEMLDKMYERVKDFDGVLIEEYRKGFIQILNCSEFAHCRFEARPSCK